MKKEIKTNAMRFLDNLNIEYEHIDYGLDHEFVSSVDLAEEGHTDTVSYTHLWWREGGV